ncbi:MAG TPA: HAMP domain-containing sensor histidine kinase [Solirubrobacteraceae bacterium]|nr:HAMP domain-containing sensor histidine kinase [Solirubrobacteraceae bacterium]
MRGTVRLGLGHLLAFVAVALVLNGQFTWWVVHSLRENRERLDLQRANLRARALAAAAQLQEQAADAADTIENLPPGVIPAATLPFEETRVVSAGPSAPLAPGWNQYEGRAVFVRPLGRERLALAFLDPQTPYRWLAALDAELQVVEKPEGESARPLVPLRAPFEHLAVTPDFQRWASLLDQYRQYVFRVLGEGAFFLAAIITAVVLLWKVLRRESALEHQHQNFVSAITHELKTPIAGIRLALETVLAGRVDDEGRTRFLTNALADSERLADLVEKVLEVTRYAGGAHRLSVMPGDLSQLVEEQVMVAERRAAAKGIEIQREVVDGIQAPFDAEALPIVVSNLLENALKYAQGSPPRVRVRLALEHGEAVLEVSDNGVGIAAGDLEAIFRPFFRAGDEVTRRTPGTGIGLFVAREIVLAHGGRLTAASEGRGKGATFRLVLPAAGLLADEEFPEYSGQK